MPYSAGFGLVLEFELHRGGGRRPDLIVLENGTILVVEFKNRVEPEASDFDQVRGYVRDLEEYHAGCRDRQLVPILVPIGSSQPTYERDGVHVTSPAGLSTLIREHARRARGQRAGVENWTTAPCKPLPALIEAARLIFEKKPLPEIRRAASARIPETVALVESLARDSIGRDQRTLILVTGVPGSGKTLVGLATAHSRQLGVPAAFLSGNGPLVQVLRFALESREIVHEVRSYLRDHLIRSKSDPHERFLVFDEAQRAWDRERVVQKHQGLLADSEPQLLVRIADRVSEGFAILALLGEGQEIHAGEESGIQLWVEAVRGRPWKVFGPRHLAAAFRAAGISYDEQSLLNLTTTLRSHRGAELATWVEHLLEGHLADAREVAERLREEGLTMRASRDLGALREYLRDRYQTDPTTRYGVIASSKFRQLAKYGVQVSRHPFYYYGQWYQAAPDDPRSCCRLEVAVSEFGCQGLELDMPLVCWGPDLLWEDNAWKTQSRKSFYIRDPRRLRLNAYRVLLTRGRDGFLIFVPPGNDFDRTYEALLTAGIGRLES